MGDYIVTTTTGKAAMDALLQEMDTEWNGWKPDHVMTSLNVFVGSLDASMIEWLLDRTEVESIEVDSVVQSNNGARSSADDQVSPESDEDTGADDQDDQDVQDAHGTPKDFLRGITINTSLQLKGTMPSDVSPINPATWQNEFDRSMTRPKTSRKVSCPTPVQRDDYVRSPMKASRRVKRGWDALHEDDEDEDDEAKEFASATPPPATDTRSADLSRVESCVSALNNPASSADFILSVFKRVEVLFAILMGTRRHRFSDEFTNNIKSALVAGHVTTAVDRYRTSLRLQASTP